MTTIKSKIEWSLLAEKALMGECLTIEEGLAVLESDNDDILSLMHAAFQVRQHFYGKKVKLNMIINEKVDIAPKIAVTVHSPSYRRRPFKNTPCSTKKHCLQEHVRLWLEKQEPTAL